MLQGRGVSVVSYRIGIGGLVSVIEMQTGVREKATWRFRTRQLQLHIPIATAKLHQHTHTHKQTIGIGVGESVVNTNPFDLFAYSSANGMELPTTRNGGMVKNDWGKKRNHRQTDNVEPLTFTMRMKAGTGRVGL